jgi:uncharacterized Rmd1/YagE family protein
LPACIEFFLQVRLAIAHALAQSSKLSVFEERVWDLVEETRWVGAQRVKQRLPELIKKG